MKELDFIEIIKNQISTDLLGDDCAYLKDLGIVVTQDNFVEDIHFKRSWATPFQIGYKATIVNISDILASGAKPAYITVGLSLPSNVDENFIKELYKGINCGLHGAKLAGGDITGADKIYISISAIGTSKDRKISSRSVAKEGYTVITHGKYGESAKGLAELMDGKQNTEAIKTHLEPILCPEFSEQIATQIDVDYAMMDTSDGLADALFRIAQASGVTIKSKNVAGMFGAEDYHLVAVVPNEFLKKIKNYEIIGTVEKFNGAFLSVDGVEYSSYDELGLYDHFGG